MEHSQHRDTPPEIEPMFRRAFVTAGRASVFSQRSPATPAVNIAPPSVDRTAAETSDNLPQAVAKANPFALGPRDTVQAPFGPYHLDVQEFVRTFKRLWFFTGDYPEPNDIDYVNGSLYFIFWKNLSVTNLSVNELIYLLREHSYYSVASQHSTQSECLSNNNVIFSTDSDFTSFFSALIESYFGAAIVSNNIEDIYSRLDVVCDFFVTNYLPMISNTILFDYFFTSVLIHVPDSLVVDLRRVVGHSGYVHSAGFALYTRNIEKVLHSALEEQINRFLTATDPQRFYLVPYCDELFSGGEKERPAHSTRNGLDGIRFQLRKHVVGKKSLLDFVTTLPLTSNGRITTPRGLAAYFVERKESKRAGPNGVPGTSDACTLWFVSDHSAFEADGAGYFMRGPTQYFIACAQLFYNESQLVLFKERKPGWTAPVTLPHTLSGALCNLAREPWRLRGGPQRPVILDPFCGTGTQLVDAKIRFPNAIVVGFDRNPLAFTLCKDNVSFFNEDAEDIDTFRRRYCSDYRGADFVTAVSDFLQKPDLNQFDFTSTDPETLFRELSFFLLSEVLADVSGEWSISSPAFSEQVQDLLDRGFSNEFNATIEDMSANQRRLCLLLWRGMVSGHFSIRDNSSLFRMLVAELSKFAHELNEYQRLLNEENLDDDGITCITTSEFSRGCRVSPNTLGSIERSLWPMSVDEILGKLLGHEIEPGIYICPVEDSVTTLNRFTGCFDLVITDPPFGFNTELDEGSMASIYGTLFGQVLRALKPGGQMILSLPDFARNGRQIPFFQSKAAVTHTILADAHAMNRRLVQFSQSLPDRTSMFRPPYYWTSVSGVARSVLHFTSDTMQ